MPIPFSSLATRICRRARQYEQGLTYLPHLTQRGTLTAVLRGMEVGATLRSHAQVIHGAGGRRWDNRKRASATIGRLGSDRIEPGELKPYRNNDGWGAALLGNLPLLPSNTCSAPCCIFRTRSLHHCRWLRSVWDWGILTPRVNVSYTPSNS